MDDCNYNHYVLQQNIYQWMLETFYPHWIWQGQSYTSVVVQSLELVVCHDIHGEQALVVSLPMIKPTVHILVEARRQSLLVS